MNPQQTALNTLISAVQVANTKGAYTLAESKVIAEAVEVFTKKEEVKEEVVAEKIEESNA